MSDKDLESLAHRRGWNEYEMYVVNELKSLREDIKDLSIQVVGFHKANTGMKKEIAHLKSQTKVQGSKWGAFGGLFGAILIALLKYFGIKE